ncbi:cyclin-dependent kinase 2-associated protein 1-like [Saccoglossus kowalevskii]
MDPLLNRHNVMVPGTPMMIHPSLGGRAPQPQSRYADLLAVIEDMSRDIRPTYAGSKSSTERLKRGR